MLRLTGRHLNLHEISQQYRILLTPMSPEDEPKSHMSCDVMMEELTDEDVMCSINKRMITANITYTIQVCASSHQLWNALHRNNL